MAVADDKVVVQYLLPKSVVTRVDEQANSIEKSRSGWLASTLDTCTAIHEDSDQVLISMMARAVGRAISNTPRRTLDEEKTSVQAVIKRKTLDRIDRYAAAVGSTRAQSLTFITEMALDEMQPIVSTAGPLVMFLKNLMKMIRKPPAPPAPKDLKIKNILVVEA